MWEPAFNSWIQKLSRREWLPTPVSMPGILQFPCLENPWKEEPRGLQSLVSHTVRTDTSEGHNFQHRELAQLCSIIFLAKNWKRTDMLYVYVITESGACILTISTKLKNKYRSILYQHEIKKREDYWLFYPLWSPSLGLLSNPWNPTRLGSLGLDWRGVETVRVGALNRAPLNLTIWFALAGTIDPSAPKGWWPDALATRILERSPSLQVCWFWCPQLKSLSRVQRPRHVSRKQCPRSGWVWKEGWSLKGKREWDTRPWCFSGTFHSYSQPRKPTFLKSQFAWRTRVGLGASLVAQLVKNLPAMQETPVWFLGQEGPLEKGKATHSSILGLPRWLGW